MKRSCAHRSGFTLLELSLAIAVGSVILLAAIAVLGTMQSVSVKFQKRADDVHEIERAQMLLRRALGSVVMATMSESRESFGQKTMERPRVLLDNTGEFVGRSPMRTPDHIQERTFRNEVKKSFRTTGSNDQELTFEHPLGTGLPRLELAVSRHPILPDSMIESLPQTLLEQRALRLALPYEFMRDTDSYSLPEGVGSTNVLTDEEGSPVAVRGVFELVANPPPPEPIAPGFQRDPQTWSLYYRPIAIYRRPLEDKQSSSGGRAGENGEGEEESEQQSIANTETEQLVEYRLLGLDESVRILSNVTFLRWIAFQGGQMRNAYRASAVTEMPAYIELEFTTASGLTAQWMFDVTWTVGGELGSVLAGSIREQEQQRLEQEQNQLEGDGGGAVRGGGSARPVTGRRGADR